jgi:ATP-dependent helicase HrpB
MAALPVDALLPAVLGSLGRHSGLVIVAPPGSGKTTRVPPALLGLSGGHVLVLEPRRLAARLAARRVAWERGEPVGESVGYQVRFEEACGPRTRLRFLTEGVLTRRLISDRHLRGVDTVVLDEFHERHLEGDVALAMLRRLQRTTRRDLRLVVMSATLDAAPVAKFLGDCPVLRAEGRLFDLAVAWQPESPDPLEARVAAAAAQIVASAPRGDILAFLPGAAEIRRAARALEPLAARHRLLVTPLYGDLSAEEQDRAVQPAASRKIILSTNLAESSVTIEGVNAVIDSGLARIAEHSPWSGLPRLRVGRVSRASLDQRAGRAGRTGPGRVIRLFSQEDYGRRPAHDAPEIVRAELSQAALELRAAGMGGWSDLEWLDAPPEAATRAADDLLGRLGALDQAGALTSEGLAMAGYPLSPRLARLVLEAARRGAAQAGCAAAAVLSSGQRLEEGGPPGASDLLHQAESDWDFQTRRIYRQLRRPGGRDAGGGGDEALLRAVLAAFPDRVARRRAGDELLLCAGGSAVLSRASVVRDAEYMVAVDIEERRERGLPLVRLASAIQPEWLLDLDASRVSERNAPEWNRAAERVEAASVLLYDELVIAESRDAMPDPVEAALLLSRKAGEAGWERFVDGQELRWFLARAEFAAGHGAGRALGDSDLSAALEEICTGRRSFRELEQAARDGEWLAALERRLGIAPGRLNEVAPARIRLPRGRTAKVNYESGKTPWVASRLQDFFGATETPRIARGAVPVVVHLLAPSQRPVQTTTDLAGFWERLYPQVRRELSRRYPKHAWPEDPLAG